MPDGLKVLGLTRGSYLSVSTIALALVLILSFNGNAYLSDGVGNWALALWGVYVIVNSLNWLSTRPPKGDVVIHWIYLFLAVVGILSLTPLIN